MHTATLVQPEWRAQELYAPFIVCTDTPRVSNQRHAAAVELGIAKVSKFNKFATAAGPTLLPQAVRRLPHCGPVPML